MKIIFDVRVLTHKNYTGVENYTKNILNYLKKDLSITIAKPKTKNKYLAHLWTHFILPFKAKNYDILFCPANIAPIWLFKNTKLVVTIHDISYIINSKSFSKSFRVYYKFLMPFIIKRADKIITVSNFSKSEIIKYYPYSKNKISIIYPALDNKYKLIDNIKKENYILYVGSLNERKNFNSVIKSFELLKREDYKLIIVGNFFSNFNLDNSNKNILKKAKSNKNIEFKSNISNNELVQIYNKSKLFIFPSFYEGFGLPPLEAMACGTPVIVSNISAMPEICEDSALYCNPYNIEDIKDKIELLLSDKNLQKKMIKKGLKKVKKFTWEKSAKEHLKVFEEVLNS